MRRTTAAAGVLAVALAVAALGPGAAGAAAYRYWTYWTSAGTDTWTFSPLGPASNQPADGAVEGWRFALSEGTQGQGAQPRITPSTAFEQFCGTLPPPPGRKRVAVVFDFGSTADAPPGQQPPAARGTCVFADADASGSQILAEAADVRLHEGLVCAIGGYPSGECAPAVPDPTATAAPTPSPDATDESQDQEAQPKQTRSPKPESPATQAPPAQDPPADDPPAQQDDPTGTPKQRDDAPGKKQSRTHNGWGGTITAGGPPAGVVTATPQPQYPSTSATAAPVFTEAEARDAGNDSGPVRALLAVALLAGLIGILGWRRASRGSSGR